MSEPVERLAYDEALRGINLQRESVDLLRSRAGTLLAAAALVTTFLGGQVLSKGRDLAGWSWVAVACFIGSAALAMVVLLPWKFTFLQDLDDLVEDHVDSDPQSDPKSMLRDMAIDYEGFRQGNRARCTVLFWSFRLAAFLLGCEVAAWLIDLSQRQV